MVYTKYDIINIQHITAIIAKCGSTSGILTTDIFVIH